MRKQKLPDEDIIRRYLLGTLRESEFSAIEERLLSSEEVSQTAGVIEDEIIEEYLDGDLGERDRKAVETHFLRPPAHREKLKFARLLRHHFELSPADDETVRHRGLIPPAPARNLWNYAGALVSVVLGAVALYFGMAKHELTKHIATSQKTQAALQSELNKERELSASLMDKLQALQTTTIAPLDLKPGITRSSGFVPQATIRPSTRFLKIDVVLPQISSTSLRVRLLDEKTGYEVWSMSGLKPVPGAPRLLFDMPTQGIRPGPYKLVVQTIAEHPVQISYPFDAHVVQ